MEVLSNVRKRKPNSEPLCCPICSITLRQHEMEAHYRMEMEKLDKLSSGSPNRNRKLTSHSPLAGCSSSSPLLSSGPDTRQHHNGDTTASNSNDKVIEVKRVTGGDCWGTYQKIRSNRQKRLKIKPKKRKTEETTCPVCNEQPIGDINEHVDRCLEKTETRLNGNLKPESDEESIDVEGETFDEYEWAGQTRVRASSMLPGGFAAAGIGTTITPASDDENELNVDGDDTQIYGPPQFSERSIVPISKDESNSYLRELVIGNEPPTSFQNDEAKEGSSSAASEHESEAPIIEAPEPLNAQQMASHDSNLIIDALTAKIREYERYIQNKPKCLICLSDFKKPVVSICCWHVYCQDCWLNSLGSRKLCPQCNMITSATDLRRIYL